MTLYHREPSQFPVNHDAEMGVDPALQRAHDAGNLPPDPPEPEPTLRGEIAVAVERVALCDATVRDIQFARFDVPRGLDLLVRRLEDASRQLMFVGQLAEDLGVRRE